MNASDAVSCETPSHDEVVAEIVTEFSQAFAAARSSWARYAAEVHPDLRGPGLMILQTILRSEPVTATALCGVLDMDKAVVSRQLAQLRELGFVSATAAVDDRRVMLLSASDQARTLLQRLQRRRADEYRTRFVGWRTAELAQLQRLLHRFNADGGSAE